MSLLRGDPLIVLEAMKMENEITAHRSGGCPKILPAIGAAGAGRRPSFHD